MLGIWNLLQMSNALSGTRTSQVQALWMLVPCKQITVQVSSVSSKLQCVNLHERGSRAYAHISGNRLSPKISVGHLSLSQGNGQIAQHSNLQRAPPSSWCWDQFHPLPPLCPLLLSYKSCLRTLAEQEVAKEACEVVQLGHCLSLILKSKV